LAQVGQESTFEGKAKSQLDRILNMTGFWTTKNSAAKAWPSDPSSPHCWGLEVTEKLPQG